MACFGSPVSTFAGDPSAALRAGDLKVAPTFAVRDPEGQLSLMATDFVSMNISIPSWPSSRPMPLCL